MCTISTQRKRTVKKKKAKNFSPFSVLLPTSLPQKTRCGVGKKKHARFHQTEHVLIGSSGRLPWMCGSTLCSSLKNLPEQAPKDSPSSASCKNEVLHSGGSRKLRNSRPPTQDLEPTQIPRLLRGKAPAPSTAHHTTPPEHSGSLWVLSPHTSQQCEQTETLATFHRQGDWCFAEGE